MSPVLIATVCGLVTAFCWGTSDYLSARSTRSLNPFQINFVSQVIGGIIAVVLFALSGIHIFTAIQWWEVVIGNLLVNIAFLIFIKALSGGVVGILVPLGNIYPLFTIMLSLLFLHLHFTALEVAAMIIIVLGAALLAYQKNHARLPLKELHKRTFWTLGAAVIWGFGFFIQSPVVGDVSWQSITIVGEIVSLPFATVLLVLTSRRDWLRDAKNAFKVKSAVTIGLFGETGIMALYLGSNHAGNTVIPTVLSAGGSLVASLWGGLFDHEVIGFRKRLGAIITVVGIVLLNLG